MLLPTSHWSSGIGIADIGIILYLRKKKEGKRRRKEKTRRPGCVWIVIRSTGFCWHEYWCLSLLGQTYLIPTLQNSHVQSGFSTKLLQELVLHQDTQQCHLQFVIQEMPSLVCMLESGAKPFDASSLQLSALLKKRIRHMPLLERMFELGLTVRKEDVQVAFEVLPNDRVDILELMLSKFKFESTSFEAIQKAAVESNKKKLLACLNKHMPEDPKVLLSLLLQLYDHVIVLLHNMLCHCILASSPGSLRGRG